MLDGSCPVKAAAGTLGVDPTLPFSLHTKSQGQPARGLLMLPVKPPGFFTFNPPAISLCNRSKLFDSYLRPLTQTFRPTSPLIRGNFVFFPLKSVTLLLSYWEINMATSSLGVLVRNTQEFLWGSVYPKQEKWRYLNEKLAKENGL